MNRVIEPEVKVKYFHVRQYNDLVRRPHMFSVYLPCHIRFGTDLVHEA
jgi:hypothetical protein